MTQPRWNKLADGLTPTDTLWECSECGARKRQSPTNTARRRACSHPVVDDATPAEEDLGMALAIRRYGALERDQVAALMELTPKQIGNIEQVALAKVKAGLVRAAENDNGTENVEELLQALLGGGDGQAGTRRTTGGFDG